MEIFQVGVALRMTAFIRSFKEASGAERALVEIHRVGSEKFLHESRNALLDKRRRKDMEVIRHEAVRADRDKWAPPRAFVDIFFSGAFKKIRCTGAVLIVEKEQIGLEAFEVHTRVENGAFIDAAIVQMIVLAFVKLCSSHGFVSFLHDRTTFGGGYATPQAPIRYYASVLGSKRPKSAKIWISWLT